MGKDIYKTTRFLYLLEAAFEYFINLLLAGAYIAKVTSTLGMNDSLTGIVTGIVSLASTFQIVALFLANKKPVKKWVTIFHTINQTFFALVYLVPFFNFSKTTKTVLFIFFLLVGYIISQIINPHKINWLMSTVDENKRGSFTATKERISLIGGMIFTFIVGSVMDKFEAQGDIYGSFIFCSIGILVLTLSHTVTLIFSKEKPCVEKTTTNIALGKLLKNKNLLKIIFITFLWRIAVYITTPFYGTYQIKELSFTMTFISIITAIGSIFRAFISKPIGKLADKSFVKVLKLCYFFGFLSLFINAFTTPSNGKVLFIIYYILNAVAMAGIDNCEMNLAYGSVCEDERVGALALRMTIAGLTGFLATLAASALVTFIQNNGNKFLGVNVYAQQVLSAIAAIIVLVILLFLKFSKGIEKEKTLDSRVN